MTTTRRLAAILAADVVGSSSMMEKDEEGTRERATHARLLDHVPEGCAARKLFSAAMNSGLPGALPCEAPSIVTSCS